MTWDFYETGEEFILKEKEVKKELLDTLNPKEKKRIKKILQSAEPTEFFGQDFTKLGELVGELKSLNFIKSDDKEYELLYRQLRDLIYPKGKKGGKK